MKIKIEVEVDVYTLLSPIYDIGKYYQSGISYEEFRNAVLTNEHLLKKIFSMVIPYMRGNLYDLDQFDDFVEFCQNLGQDCKNLDDIRSVK